MDYGRLAIEYVHDSNCSLEDCQQQLVGDQLRAAVAINEKPKQVHEEMIDKDLQQLKKRTSNDSPITLVAEDAKARWL